jgi:hypothetical protein
LALAVHQSARRGLGQDSGNSANGQRNPHTLLVPPISREVDGEEWSDSRLDVGKKEIQPVQTAQRSPRRGRSRFYQGDKLLRSLHISIGQQVRCGGLVEHGAQGMAAVVLCETSQPPPNALINWTLAVICCIRRFMAVR